MPDSIFNPLDCMVLVGCLLSATVGFRRRLSGEIANVIGFIFATILIMSFLGTIAATLVEHTSLSSRSATFASYLVVIVATMLLVFFVSKVLGGIMKFTISQGMDHFLGALAGLLRALIIMYLITLGLLACPIGWISEKTATGSFSGALTVRSLPYLTRELDKWQDADEPVIDDSASL